MRTSVRYCREQGISYHLLAPHIMRRRSAADTMRYCVTVLLAAVTAVTLLGTVAFADDRHGHGHHGQNDKCVECQVM
jgi:hypothetical protein